MTRKKANYNIEDPSALQKRFESMILRDLKDHRYSVYFKLNDIKRYEDDP